MDFRRLRNKIYFALAVGLGITYAQVLTGYELPETVDNTSAVVTAYHQPTPDNPMMAYGTPGVDSLRAECQAELTLIAPYYEAIDYWYVVDSAVIGDELNVSMSTQGVIYDELGSRDVTVFCDIAGNEYGVEYTVMVTSTIGF